MSTPAFYWGTGRRKTAVARVRLLPGEGQMVVNGRTPEEHFGGAFAESELYLPFRVTGTEGRFNAMIKVEGGGVTGQAGAIRHGIARALLQADPEANRLPLRQASRPRPADEGAQEVQAEAGPQGPSTRSGNRRTWRPSAALPAAGARSRTSSALALVLAGALRSARHLRRLASSSAGPLG
jgi:small subunit ribosomal protein S9